MHWLSHKNSRANTLTLFFSDSPPIRFSFSSYPASEVHFQDRSNPVLILLSIFKIKMSIGNQ